MVMSTPHALPLLNLSAKTSTLTVNGSPGLGLFGVIVTVVALVSNRVVAENAS